MEGTALAGSVLVIAGAIVHAERARTFEARVSRVGQRRPRQRRRRQLPGSTKTTYPLPGFQARGFLAALGKQ
jgi:hypothetical protein